MAQTSTAGTSSTSSAPVPVLRGILTGQNALVTGANSGIGRGVAIALGKAGANPAITIPFCTA